ncbi:MAG TPA: sulfur oxidation protein SoxY [Alcaligenaceae bacterium]|nr:sulfur oxidation protein SoxY [Alcaligenaceae bacterium]
MTSSNDLAVPLLKRRQLILSAALGLSSSAFPTLLHAQTASVLQSTSQAETQALVEAFLQGAEPLTKGISLDMPALGDNPAAVPIKVVFDIPIDEQNYCEELIILAEGNPKPLACSFTFTPLAGTTEVAVRLRLIESQTIKALARMSDGSYLMTQRHITVTAGGCGM